jgi:hypothetical protein
MNHLNGEDGLPSSTGLSVGTHNVTIYAWDSAGNAGTSQTINFKVAPSQEQASTIQQLSQRHMS